MCRRSSRRWTVIPSAPPSSARTAAQTGSGSCPPAPAGAWRRGRCSPPGVALVSWLDSRDDPVDAVGCHPGRGGRRRGLPARHRPQGGLGQDEGLLPPDGERDLPLPVRPRAVDRDDPADAVLGMEHGDARPERAQVVGAAASAPSPARGLDLGRVGVEEQADLEPGVAAPRDRLGDAIGGGPTTSSPPSVVSSSRRSGTSVTWSGRDCQGDRDDRRLDRQLQVEPDLDRLAEQRGGRGPGCAGGPRGGGP